MGEEERSPSFSFLVHPLISASRFRAEDSDSATSTHTKPRADDCAYKPRLCQVVARRVHVNTYKL
jgi:hypothetical protein